MQFGENIRNFGFAAHIDAGKTTTTERLLYTIGKTYKLGEVDEGTTTTDWMLEEKERGITITSAAVSGEWKDCVFHIIDTPGHVDFIAEVHRSLRVLDGVVVVICGVGGVQTQTEAVWKEADKFKIPRIIYVNKLDRAGANFEAVLDQIEAKFNTRALAVSIPYYEDNSLAGIIDILSMKLLTFSDDGKTVSSGEIPAAYASLSAEYRERFIDIITEFDEDLLEKVIEERYTDEDIIGSIKRGVLSGDFIPLTAGSSLKNIGVAPLADCIVNFLPSPLEVPPAAAHNLKSGKDELIDHAKDVPPVLYVFKVQYDRDKGPLAFARIYSGEISGGMTLYNKKEGEKERVQEILKIFANKFERVEQAAAGDIVILTGLKHTVTGDTLGTAVNQLLLEPLSFPEPVIYMKVEPRNAVDIEKFNHARPYFLLEDPTLTYLEDKDTGETLIGGMGELHLEIILNRMRTEHKIDIKSGNPRVAHREVPEKEAVYTFVFEMKIEGSVNHVTITLRVKPAAAGAGITIENKCKSKISADFYKAVKQGIEGALISGPEAAYPVIDSCFYLEELDFDTGKTVAAAVTAAASMCTTNVLREAKTKLLEPVMRLEIQVPDSFTGTVIGDIQSRSGIIMDIYKKSESGNQIDYEDLITARAPLKQLFGYATALRSLTQGKGNFTMKFLEFA